MINFNKSMDSESGDEKNIEDIVIEKRGSGGDPDKMEGLDFLNLDEYLLEEAPKLKRMNLSPR